MKRAASGNADSAAKRPKSKASAKAKSKASSKAPGLLSKAASKAKAAARTQAKAAALAAARGPGAGEEDVYEDGVDPHSPDDGTTNLEGAPLSPDVPEKASVSGPPPSPGKEPESGKKEPDSVSTDLLSGNLLDGAAEEGGPAESSGDDDDVVEQPEQDVFVPSEEDGVESPEDDDEDEDEDEVAEEDLQLATGVLPAGQLNMEKMEKIESTSRTGLPQRDWLVERRNPVLPKSAANIYQNEFLKRYPTDEETEQELLLRDEPDRGALLSPEIVKKFYMRQQLPIANYIHSGCVMKAGCVDPNALDPVTLLPKWRTPINTQNDVFERLKTHPIHLRALEKGLKAHQTIAPFGQKLTFHGDQTAMNVLKSLWDGEEEEHGLKVDKVNCLGDMFSGFCCARELFAGEWEGRELLYPHEDALLNVQGTLEEDTLFEHNVKAITVAK